MTIAPPAKTNSTKNASAIPSVIRHSWPTRLWAVTFGVARRVWPSRVRTGSSASVTRLLNQSSMAASMWPVMSNSPGEGWVPPLTVPPLPDAGTLGVVVPDGPTWIGGGPSPAVPEPDVAEPDVAEPPVPEVDVCELGVVAPVVAAAADALGLVAVGEAVRAAVSTTA